jgi:hypothetical protein
MTTEVMETHPLIHHSDRAVSIVVRVCRFIERSACRHLHDRKGDPYENALAERMNGIIRKNLICTAVRRILKTRTNAF